MNCPHCGVHVDEHPASDCFDLWVLKDVFGWTTSITPYKGDFYPRGSYFVIWHQPDDFMPDVLLIISQAFDKDGNNLRSTKDNPLGIWDETPDYNYSLGFSTNIAAAWKVVMHFKDRQYSVVLEGGDAFAWSRWDFSIWSPLDDPDFSDEMAHGWDESRDLNDRVAFASLAVCRAAIKATKESE